MPDKDYRIYLEGEFEIEVSIKMAAGRVAGFVIRLVDARGDGKYDLARYDTAHGAPHLDIVSRSGRLREKHWLENTSIKEALDHAIKDFKQNRENYVDQDRQD